MDTDGISMGERKEIENETLKLSLVKERSYIYDNIQRLLNPNTPDNIREIIEALDNGDVDYDDDELMDNLTFKVAEEMEKQGIPQEIIDKFYDLVQCDHAIYKQAKAIVKDIEKEFSAEIEPKEETEIPPPIFVDEYEYYFSFNRDKWDKNIYHISVLVEKDDSCVGDWEIPFSKKDLKDFNFTIEDIEELIRHNISD